MNRPQPRQHQRHIEVNRNTGGNGYKTRSQKTLVASGKGANKKASEIIPLDDDDLKGF